MTPDTHLRVDHLEHSMAGISEKVDLLSSAMKVTTLNVGKVESKVDKVLDKLECLTDYQGPLAKLKEDVLELRSSVKTGTVAPSGDDPIPWGKITLGFITLLTLLITYVVQR